MSFLSLIYRFNRSAYTACSSKIPMIFSNTTPYLSFLISVLGIMRISRRKKYEFRKISFRRYRKRTRNSGFMIIRSPCFVNAVLVKKINSELSTKKWVVFCYFCILFFLFISKCNFGRLLKNAFKFCIVFTKIN